MHLRFFPAPCVVSFDVAVDVLCGCVYLCDATCTMDLLAGRWECHVLQGHGK